MAQKINVFIVGILLVSSVASARIMILPDTTRFQQQVTFTVNGIVTPKVVQYQTIESLGSFVALKNDSTGEYIPHRLSSITVEVPWNLPIESSSDLIEGSLRFLQDQNLNNAVTFDSRNQTKEIIFNNPENRKLSVLKLDLDTNTVVPESVSLQALVRGSDTWQTIIDRQNFRTTIRFPEIQPTQLRLQIESPNLLRIAELEWTTVARSALRTQTVSFFAEEGETYTLFSQPSFGQERAQVIINTPTATNNNTPTFNLPLTERNPNFDPDFDNDGLVDTLDLCPRTPDNTNADADQNGLGDACEDPDQDGLNSNQDNCPFLPNRNQIDSDKDGIGDICDPTENRFTEQSGWWINISFGIMVLVLLAFVARSVWPRKN